MVPPFLRRYIPSNGNEIVCIADLCRQSAGSGANNGCQKEGKTDD